ncbi:MAG: thioesterase family protein [Archangium sp.]|nr:thioesterase family protein [Archangium sp.]
MAFTARVRVRFADIDWARVVYFARFFDFAHRTFEDFFNDHAKLPYAALLAERKLGFPIVSSQAEFFAPLRLGDTARIVMDVIKLSKRSVTSRFTLYRDETDERCAVIVLKQAAIDTTDFKGIEYPDDIHALFVAHLKTGE